MTAVDPTNPLNIVAVTTKTPYSIVEYYSHDGGKTWNWNEFDTGGVDPCVTFDANGNVFLAWLYAGPNLLESTDKGASFGSPVLLTGLSGDKEMIAAGLDPTTGRQAVYVSYLNYEGSQDSTPAEEVIGILEDSSGLIGNESPKTSALLPKYRNSGAGFWAHPVVGSAGQLYVVWEYGNYGSIVSICDPDGLWGPASFGQISTIVTSPPSIGLPIEAKEPASPNRGISFGLVAGLDPLSGSLYAAWAQPRSAAFYNSIASSGNDPTCSILVSKCTNPDSATPIWSAPTAVDPIASTAECSEFLPWLSVDPSSGLVAVSYLTTDGNASGNLADVRPRLAWSTDGGSTWSKQNLTNQTSNMSYDASHFEYGEYMGLAVVDGTVHAGVAMQTSSSSEDVYGIDASFVSSDGSNLLTISGSASADNISIQRDSTNSDYLDVLVNGSTAYSGLFASVDRVSVLGGEKDDALSLDTTSGTPVPWEGLSFDGGTGSNTIGLLGTGARDAISVAPGQIAATGSFGSEVVTFNNVGGISYTPGAGSHALTVNGTVPLTIPRSTGTGIREIDLANLSIGSGSKVVVQATSATPGDYSLHANRSVLVAGALQLAVDANGNLLSTLDLGDNDLILRDGGTTGLGAIHYDISSGFADGAWNGTGLDSSSAVGSTPAGALGFVLNDGSQMTPFTTFDGVTVGSSDVLVKYTYAGDADLNGQVNGDDYFYIDSNYPMSSGSTWVTGDFDYNGVTNGDDYFYIDSNYLAGTGGANGPQL